MFEMFEIPAHCLGGWLAVLIALLRWLVEGWAFPTSQYFKCFKCFNCFTCAQCLKCFKYLRAVWVAGSPSQADMHNI